MALYDTRAEGGGSGELPGHKIRYGHRTEKNRLLMAVTTPGHEQTVLPGEFNIVCRGFRIVS
jgi:hypothetical protein